MPLDVYDYTIDEIVLAYKGRVDELRFHRAGYDLIHRSLSPRPANILEVLPLPFDSDIESLDLIEEYKRLRGG